MLRRLGAWRTMLLSDAIRAPLMLAIPLLHWAGIDAFAPILVLAFLLGALAGPYFAAQKVIVPELLGEDEALVGRANALFQGATRITMLLGPVARRDPDRDRLGAVGARRRRGARTSSRPCSC